MANTIVEFDGPPSATVTLTLFASQSDTIVNGAGDSGTEQTNRGGTYLATVTEALAGWYKAYITISSVTMPIGWVFLADDTNTYTVDRIGSPAGASVSADIATAQIDLTQIKADLSTQTATPTWVSQTSSSSSSSTLIPLYDIGDIIYLRESAAIGFLEAVKISGVMLNRQGWIYTIEAKAGQPRAPSHIGDRITAVQGTLLYFSEDEFVVHCDALALVEANLQDQLDRVQAQRTSACAEPTAGT